VVGRDGERGFVEELELAVALDLDSAAPPPTVYRFDDDECVAELDGSFVVASTGERLRRVV
jgi:hypothetical protein